MRSKGDAEMERRLKLNNVFHIMSRIYSDSLLAKEGVDVENPGNPEVGYLDPEARHNEDGSENLFFKAHRVYGAAPFSPMDGGVPAGRPVQEHYGVGMASLRFRGRQSV